MSYLFKDCEYVQDKIRQAQILFLGVLPFYLGAISLSFFLSSCPDPPPLSSPKPLGNKPRPASSSLPILLPNDLLGFLI